MKNHSVFTKTYTIVLKIHPTITRTILSDTRKIHFGLFSTILHYFKKTHSGIWKIHLDIVIISLHQEEDSMSRRFFTLPHSPILEVIQGRIPISLRFCTITHSYLYIKDSSKDSSSCHEDSSWYKVYLQIRKTKYLLKNQPPVGKKKLSCLEQSLTGSGPQIASPGAQRKDVHAQHVRWPYYWSTAKTCSPFP